jgi:hypothetical protein
VAAGCEVRILVYGQDQDAVFKEECGNSTH